MAKSTSVNPEVVPLQERLLLTVEQAAAYSGIGQKKIRALIDANPNAGFYLTNGNRHLIKRKQFEAYIERQTSL